MSQDRHVTTAAAVLLMKSKARGKVKHKEALTRNWYEAYFEYLFRYDVDKIDGLDLLYAVHFTVHIFGALRQCVETAWVALP